MGWNKPLEFHERFTVTKCQNPDYCNHCNKLIRAGQIKVMYKGNQFHKNCIEEYSDGTVKVNLETWRVEPNG